MAYAKAWASIHTRISTLSFSYRSQGIDLNFNGRKWWWQPWISRLYRFTFDCLSDWLSRMLDRYIHPRTRRNRGMGRPIKQYRDETERVEWGSYSLNQWLNLWLRLLAVSKLDPATCFSTHPIHHESAVEMVTTTWPLKIKMMHRAAEGWAIRGPVLRTVPGNPYSCV